MLKKQPKSIFLQTGPDALDVDAFFNNLSEVSWHKERIYDTDLEYISLEEAIKGGYKPDTAPEKRPGTWTEEDLDDYFGLGKGGGNSAVAGGEIQGGVGVTIFDSKKIYERMSEIEMVDGKPKWTKNEWLPYAETEEGKKFWEERQKAAAGAGGEIQGGLDNGQIGRFSHGPYTGNFDKIVNFKDMGEPGVVFFFPKSATFPITNPSDWTKEEVEDHGKWLSILVHPGSPEPQNTPTSPTNLMSFDPTLCKCGKKVDTITGNLMTGIPFDYLVCDECYAKEEK